MKVFIPTAGMGTRMGPMGKTINKALFPVDGRAAISHIIDNFPEDTKFVVALGFASDQVSGYLRAAHPAAEIQYIEIETYANSSAGPGRTLLESSALLIDEPFYFVACDSLFDPADLEVLPGIEDGNWIGVDKVTEPGSYCMVRLDRSGQIDEILENASVEGDEYWAFNGIMYIRDSEKFFENLERGVKASDAQMAARGKVLSPQISLGFAELKPLQVHRMESWRDIGNLKRYEEVVGKEGYDFSKTNEAIYRSGDRVIKIFADTDVAKRRVEKASLKPDLFPKLLPLVSGGGVYAYEFVPGKTLYESNEPATFRRFLDWMDRNVWEPTDEDIRALCVKFYHLKTLERLKAFRTKYPDFVEAKYVNDEDVKPIDHILARIAWGDIAQGVGSFIHGDLQFDNVIYRSKIEDHEFVLLDWRHDFGGRVDIGDLYYDFAKLLGGIRLNYDYVKKNLFAYQKEHDYAMIDVAKRTLMTKYEAIFKEFVVGAGYDWKRVELLTGIIYLNMAPLHTAPFDQFLYVLAQQTLSKCIS